jgi:protein subunit release factor B
MKKLLFSITKDDFDIQFTKGSGKGGQKRNKCETACRIVHPESGAVGYSETERSQLQNKKLAFERLVNSDKFRQWHKIETAKHLGLTTDIEQKVNDMMNPTNLKVEYIGGDPDA